MEFEEITKVWDQQNKQNLFVINEEAMHNRIRAKLKSATKLNDINDFGLIAISVLTAGGVFYLKGNSTWNIFTAVALLGITVYIIVNRFKRKKRNKQFDLSMLGGLNHAIENVNFEVKRSKTFVLWFLLPTAIPSIINMINEEASIGRWLLVIGAYILSIFVTQLGLNRKLIPRRKNLETLRNQLIATTTDTKA